MPKPYDVLDVCYLVIKICNENKYIISNLKLQKVLYFIQAYFLSREGGGIPCFRQEIEAWPYGPVVRKAYEEYKAFGSGSIPIMNFRYEAVPGSTIDMKKIMYDSNAIEPDDIVRIEKVVKVFGHYSAFDLVEQTHAPGSPWSLAYKKGEKNIITLESIRRYYDK